MRPSTVTCQANIDVCYADFAVIRFPQFADAAFPRSRGACIVATQRVSSIQPFATFDFVQTDTSFFGSTHFSLSASSRLDKFAVLSGWDRRFNMRRQAKSMRRHIEVPRTHGDTSDEVRPYRY